MIQGFKEFIMRGNVIDLAVAVVIGAAFTAVVTALVTGIFNPLIAAIFDTSDLAGAMVVSVGSAKLSFGLVLAALINFVLIAAVVYFVFVLPINRMKEAQDRRRRAGVVDEAAPASELELLAEIRDLLAVGTAKETKHTL
ncbi:large conductance mechanosensitive channel protein MscL [Glaciibacter psychrotolerans]|uniref:Large-conductance mechanosensitive channel n=1 Tax=Glaciibacter psychrotolerans TaxID=670054 RepID=A0A7Z0ECB2_9MICO|nr:large conductance mechanosensitive channel protein MscL [Leifsonia psychrotolerans]NYJ18302.1 large conductance mechanosensitive channel [Leifsonia psychrotolerans]